MIQEKLTVTLQEGIQFETANEIVNTADRFSSKIRFNTDYMEINGKSIISLISATFREGDTFCCVCDGKDEKEALLAIKNIISP